MCPIQESVFFFSFFFLFELKTTLFSQYRELIYFKTHFSICGHKWKILYELCMTSSLSLSPPEWILWQPFPFDFLIYIVFIFIFLSNCLLDITPFIKILLRQTHLKSCIGTPQLLSNSKWLFQLHPPIYFLHIVFFIPKGTCHF